MADKPRHATRRRSQSKPAKPAVESTAERTRGAERRPVGTEASAGILTGVQVSSARRAQMLAASLGHLYRQPINSLLILAVVGMALALPLGFAVLLDNLRQVGMEGDGHLQASLYLTDRVSDERAQKLAEQLQQRAEIDKAEALKRSEALAEFRELSGFSSALDLLDENPLPATIILTLSDNSSRQALTALVSELQRQPEVETAQFDEEWLRRLHAITTVVQRAVIIVSFVLGLAVIIVVGATIGLDIQNRRDEIAVIKLVGGTDAFIQRPFVYSGLWYGLGGGVLACLLVFVSLMALNGPVAELAALYDSDYRLQGAHWPAFGITLAVASVLGVLGSWIAVSRQIRRIEPD